MEENDVVQFEGRVYFDGVFLLLHDNKDIDIPGEVTRHLFENEKALRRLELNLLAEGYKDVANKLSHITRANFVKALHVDLENISVMQNFTQPFVEFGAIPFLVPCELNVNMLRQML